MGTISFFLQNLVSYSFLFEILVDKVKNWYYNVRHLLQNEKENSPQK